MNKRGYSLIEVLVAVGVFVLITGSIFSLLSLSWQFTRSDKEKNGALAVATEKMEVIKNLPYDNIGTLAGVPAGDVADSEDVELNDVTYTVDTEIYYIDDPFDGLISEGDTLNIDYKQIKISVTWPSANPVNPVEIITNVAPRHLEQDLADDTGTLYIEVYDSDPSPVSGATVTVSNDTLVPAVYIEATTNADGVYTLPGAPIATQTYEISVTKAGYSTSQTYDLDPVSNPNPDPAHLSVGDDEVTTKLFTIDLLSDLTIQAKTYDTDTAITSFPFTLNGDETMGTDGEGADIYKYEQAHTTDASGQVVLTNLEADNYTITFDNAVTGYDLAGYDNNFPLILSPDATTTWNIYLAPHTTNNLLVTILNEIGGVLEGATARLYKTDLTYDQSIDTNVRGQVFFSGLDATMYNLDISKTGYQTNLIEVSIDEQTSQTIPLVLSP